MPARPILAVLLSAVLLVACRPTPSDDIAYLHREDSIIIQMLVITFVGMGLRMLWRERRLIELLEVALGAEAEEIDRV